MKLFFLKDNSLYKIFKTLEKVPNNKTVHIYIDPEHAFFDNERRGKQLQEIIQEKKLKAFFVTKTEKAKNFFQKIGLNVIHQEKHKIFKALNLMYLFFFNIKNFHLQMYAKKNYIFYAIFGFESAFFLIILYLLYSLILPSTMVTITPANQVENIIYNFRYYAQSDTEYTKGSRYLNIPYSTGFIDYKYEMSISTANIKHIQNPSKGQIRVVNTTDQPYSLIKGTRWETNDGLMYTSDDRFKVAAADGDTPGETIISITAKEQDAGGAIIGARGNISKETKMFIKNIKSSYYFKEIYGEAITQFSGGTLVSQGSITQKDINTLSGKLAEYIEKQKQNIAGKNFTLEGNLLLNFDDLIDIDIKSITINNQVGEKQTMLKGTVISRINFMYINTNDLLEGINKYLDQRPSDKVKLLNIDSESIVFFNDIKENEGVYVIPTQVNVIQGYDFAKDINGVLDSVKTRIIGIRKDEAKEILLSFPEIASTKIKVRPPWYSSLPKLKSRIKISVEGQNIGR